MGKINLADYAIEDELEFASKISELLDIVDDLTEWEVQFVMDMAEGGLLSEKQEATITEIYYKHIGRFQ